MHHTNVLSLLHQITIKTKENENFNKHRKRT
jgi:hypothetical protein